MDSDQSFLTSPDDETDFSCCFTENISAVTLDPSLHETPSRSPPRHAARPPSERRRPKESVRKSNRISAKHSLSHRGQFAYSGNANWSHSQTAGAATAITNRMRLTIPLCNNGNLDVRAKAARFGLSFPVRKESDGTLNTLEGTFSNSNNHKRSSSSCYSTYSVANSAKQKMDLCVGELLHSIAVADNNKNNSTRMPSMPVRQESTDDIEHFSESHRAQFLVLGARTDAGARSMPAMPVRKQSLPRFDSEQRWAPPKTPSCRSDAAVTMTHIPMTDESLTDLRIDPPKVPVRKESLLSITDRMRQEMKWKLWDIC